ncbi:MAG: V-type ATP synthase subunit E [Candidatus Diapherotrites archaeon]
MALRELVQEIEEEAQQEAKKLRSEAKEANALLEEAERQKEQILAKAKSEAARLIEAEQNQRIAAARLKARQIQAEAVEHAINASLDEAWEALLEMRKEKEYRDSLHANISEAKKELGENATVEVNKDDRKLVAGHKVEEIECAGGAIIKSADGKIRIDATLEELFAQKKGVMRKKIFDALFAGALKKPEAKMEPLKVKEAKTAVTKKANSNGNSRKKANSNGNKKKGKGKKR